MDKILVVEDDPIVQKALKRLFVSNGYSVEIAPTGNAGLESFRSAPPSAIILDLRLPGMAGQEVCREIKSKSPALPVIVLSANTDVVDKVLLLELGADDYVTKPFSPRELLARVQASIRRASRLAAVPDLFAFGDITVDFTRMELTQA
ncbi:MAG TPA: response regulator transcription factor, partial [Candidatus Angelobacter sp.]|nr:response regulator transcription factor [Candidatus Angelobacter sp.]